MRILYILLVLLCCTVGRVNGKDEAVLNPIHKIPGELALIPVILLFCLLYSPVLMDLSDFIPGYSLLSWLAPTRWYFALYNLF